MSVTKLLVASALGLMLVFAAASPAAAHRPYDDEDSGYLRVVSTVVRPVGQLLEWVVFRPLHTISTAIRNEAGPITHPSFHCANLRPRRGCGPRR